MKISFLPMVFTVLCGSLFMGDAQAVSIYCVGGSAKELSRLADFPKTNGKPGKACVIGLLKGKLERGDAKRFSRFVAENQPALSTVMLASPGGSVEDSLEIGRLIRKYHIETHAPYLMPNGGGVLINPLTVSDSPYSASGKETLGFLCEGKDCICASSCFLIWAGGVHREGTALGVHRPSIKSTRFANLHADEAANLYRQLLSEVAEYLKEMEIPNSYSESMTATGSQDIFWLGNETQDAIGDPPSIAEWITASCGVTTKRDMEYQQKLLENVSKGSKWSKRDFANYIGEIKKSQAINLCRWHKFFEHRKSLVTLGNNVPPSQNPNDYEWEWTDVKGKSVTFKESDIPKKPASNNNVVLGTIAALSIVGVLLLLCIIYRKRSIKALDAKPLPTKDSLNVEQPSTPREERMRSCLIGLLCFVVFITAMADSTIPGVYAIPRTVLFYFWMRLVFAPSEASYPLWMRIVFSVGLGAIYKASAVVALYLSSTQPIQPESLGYSLLITLVSGAILGVIFVIPFILAKLFKRLAHRK